MIFRAARHTNDLRPLIDFYTRIIGLEVLGSFTDHDGYDGVFLGKPGHDWHLEFTRSPAGANHVPDPDDLLVFYPQDIPEYHEINGRIDKHGIIREIPENPYWRTNGIMIKDPDGFGVVISHGFVPE